MALTSIHPISPIQGRIKSIRGLVLRMLVGLFMDMAMVTRAPFLLSHLSVLKSWLGWQGPVAAVILVNLPLICGQWLVQALWGWYGERQLHSSGVKHSSDCSRCSSFLTTHLLLTRTPRGPNKKPSNMPQ